MRVIGMMSGTSMDGVDAAAADLTLDGSTLTLRPLGMVSSPYPDELSAALGAAMPPAPTTMEQVCRLDTLIGQAFADTAERAVAELCGGRADLVVSHGQTLFHWVEDEAVRGTLQLGQPAWIAERTGCTVVSDLRTRDVAAGGQGAPLVSAFDQLWLRGRLGTTAALNLGGIANLTAVGPGRDPVAFDTGPANALIDAAVSWLTDGASHYDEDGRLAGQGGVHPALLARLLDEDYYRRTPPKTTGKELFHLGYLQAAMDGIGPIEPADLVATVTELTARTVAHAVRQVGAGEVIASGGGTANPTLMARLVEACAPATVVTSDELGLPSGSKEAYAFAVLGFLSVHGLPGTVPSCTGARHASVLGSITPGLRSLDTRPPAGEEVLIAPSQLAVVQGPAIRLYV